MRENEVINRIIPGTSIIDVAKFFERYKKSYYRAVTRYIVYFSDGRPTSVVSLAWLEENIKEPETIQSIIIQFKAKYPFDKKRLLQENANKEISFEVKFSENKAVMSVKERGLEKEANRIFGKIREMLEVGDFRYNKTIKNSFLRIESFSLAVGILIADILYLIILNGGESFSNIYPMLVERNIVLFILWLATIVLGNIIGLPIILKIYDPLLKTSLSKLDKKGYFSREDEFKSYSEVQIGRYAKSQEKRKLIEVLFIISRILIFTQIVLSVIIFVSMDQ